MEIKSEQPLRYSATTPKPSNASFGTQVSEKADNVHNSDAVTAKKQFNQGILQASMAISLSVGNNPMALLFKTALERVNNVLEEELGPDAIQKSDDSGLDVSPQATADRIIQFSKAFFGRYQANHSDLSTEQALDSFTTLIGGGIDKGFKEAKDILEGLNVSKEGNIGSHIDATYALVQKGLQAFVENHNKPAITEPDTSA